jgi:hypothetical protein
MDAVSNIFLPAFGNIDFLLFTFILLLKDDLR